MSYRNMAILTDVTKCIGCEKCVAACQQENDLPKERMWRWLSRITDLSSARWTTIVDVESDKGRRFVRRQCRHCLEPACVEACIVGALKKTPEGAIVYDTDICIGCRYCMVACPWEIPKYSWEDRVPLIQKCNLCYDRVTKKGAIPACVSACPTQATIFGEREDLLAEARRRLKAQPNRYIQQIWGEHEVGGSSVLYISDVDLRLDELASPVTDSAPVPQRTYAVLSKMPSAFVLMSALMAGTYWVIERRQKLMGGGKTETGGEGEERRQKLMGDGKKECGGDSEKTGGDDESNKE